jgi:hypothetical protein
MGYWFWSFGAGSKGLTLGMIGEGLREWKFEWRKSGSEVGGVFWSRQHAIQLSSRLGQYKPWSEKGFHGS